MKEKSRTSEACIAETHLHLTGEPPFPVKTADSFSRRFLGLMGRREGDYGLFLTPCDAIHMMFMRFALDAVFVDADGVIVSIAAGVKPWGFAFGGKRARAVLELPASRSYGTRLQIGMKLPLW